MNEDKIMTASLVAAVRKLNNLSSTSESEINAIILTLVACPSQLRSKYPKKGMSRFVTIDTEAVMKVPQKIYIS
jgi:hypothetical protein